jgi:hypothetical protein
MAVTAVTIIYYPFHEEGREGPGRSAGASTAPYLSWRSGIVTDVTKITGPDRIARPPHRPCVSPSRARTSPRRVTLLGRRNLDTPRFHAAWLPTGKIIVRNIFGVIPFRCGDCCEMPMSFSVELVPCCRTRTLPDGTQDKFYWLLIYTDPSTCTWREEFFRRKVEAETARKALWDKWGPW